MFLIEEKKIKKGNRVKKRNMYWVNLKLKKWDMNNNFLIQKRKKKGKEI